MCRMFGLEKPRIRCWPASRARKIWTSSRATGLKALAVRLGAICFRVVMRSKLRMASVGSSTWAKALRYRPLAARETSLYEMSRPLP